MAAEKFAVSFDPDLAARVRAEARAARKLRRMAARAVLEAYEAEHGEITESELAEVRAQWPA